MVNLEGQCHEKEQIDRDPVIDPEGQIHVIDVDDDLLDQEVPRIDVSVNVNES